MNKVFSSEIIASTDLHAGGHLFGVLFRKHLRFLNDGVVYLEKYVVDDFNPLDKSDVFHLNSFKITGRWEKSDSVKIKCVFESIFLEMTGIVGPNNNERLIFHCYDSRLSKQWGETYLEVIKKIKTKKESFESKDNMIFSIDYQEKINQFNKENNLKGWQQFYKNFIANSFIMNDDEYLAYLQSIRCPFGFIGTASKIKDTFIIIEKLVSNKADKELIQTLAIICSGSFLEQRNIRCEEWLNSKKWIDFKNNEEFSIIDILELYGNGNAYIKTKVMSMPIFKIF